MAPSILVVAEVADGTLTRLSTELATLARALAEASGGSAVGLVVDASPDAAAAELATFLPRVVSVASTAAGDPDLGAARRGRGRAARRRGHDPHPARRAPPTAATSPARWSRGSAGGCSRTPAA